MNQKGQANEVEILRKKLISFFEKSDLYSPL